MKKLVPTIILITILINFVTANEYYEKAVAEKDDIVKSSMKIYKNFFDAYVA